MKSYFTHERFHLVGKAWEVRRCLQLMVKDAASKEQPLCDYLAKFSRNASVRAGSPKPPAPRRRPSGKIPDPA